LPVSVKGIQKSHFSQSFILYHPCPNPFKPSTTIKYFLSEASEIRLEIFNILGIRINVLDEGIKSSGEHSVELNNADLAAELIIFV
jgi:hypothetical protein